MFNDLDAAFVRSRGFIVLEDPEAQNKMTPATLLFAIKYDPHIVEDAFEISYPAIMIGGDFRPEVHMQRAGFIRTNYIGPTIEKIKAQKAIEKMKAEKAARQWAEYERLEGRFHKGWSWKQIPVPAIYTWRGAYWRPSGGLPWPSAGPYLPDGRRRWYW